MNKRSEKTIEMILKSAELLFSKKGYNAVTMREIAKDAGCSHTTIYLYFKDKEALLQELSIPSLRELHSRLSEISEDRTKSAEQRLKQLSLVFLQFCLEHRNLYDILLNAQSTKVDDEKPEMEINQLRLTIFNTMKKVIQEHLSISGDEQLLAFSRVYYYSLNGILNTYTYLHEPIDELMKRLRPTFDLNVEVLLLGFKEKLKRGNENESRADI